MKTEDRQIIESLKDKRAYAKLDVKRLAKIYTTQTGEKVTNCFCSQSERDSYAKTFYEWYNKINESDDTGSTI